VKHDRKKLEGGMIRELRDNNGTVLLELWVMKAVNEIPPEGSGHFYTVYSLYVEELRGVEPNPSRQAFHRQ